jgi:hypothetical protein
MEDAGQKIGYLWFRDLFREFPAKPMYGVRRGEGRFVVQKAQRYRRWKKLK